MVLIGPVFQIAFVFGLNRYINNSNKKRTSKDNAAWGFDKTSNIEGLPL